jgi:hypothetical protein
MDTIGVMQTVKKSLDPLWLMNPGKIFDAINAGISQPEPVSTTASALERVKGK